MTHFRFAGVFALCAALPLAAEAEFVGGRAAISHSAFTDDNDFAKSQAQGAAEFAFGNSFGLQADMGIAGLHALDDTAFNLTGHAVWTFAPGSAAGLFYGSDLMSGPDHDIYGAEYAGFLGEAKVEGYLARSESGEGDANMIGLAGSMPVGMSGLEMGLSADHAAFSSDGSATRVGLNGAYPIGESTRLTGEVGSVGGGVGNDDMSGPYVKLGIDFRFGANAGTTFGSRSIFNVTPGM